MKTTKPQLTHDFGKGFEERELRKIRQFYLAFPIRDALRPELGWLMEEYNCSILCKRQNLIFT
jgi:hypothetical protein